MSIEEKQRKGLQSGQRGKQSTGVLRGQAMLVLLAVLPAGLDCSGRGDAEDAAKEICFFVEVSGSC